MQYSEYYGLWLPEGSEFFSKDHSNHNMEAIDTLLKEFDDTKIGTDKISKNFTTEDWGQVAAAPLIKQLYEENQSLKQQLNNKKFAYEKESYVSANSTLQLELSKGMYIITFGQGGAWDITGMAFAVMTDMQQSSVCYKVCGSAMFLEKMDIVLNASSKTINITNGNGANVTLRIYSI